MSTRGTNHFKSFDAALRYYKDYGFDKEKIQQKINEKEIIIGKPKIKKGELFIHKEEGRYFIKED